jgi:hypothetical protein
MFKMMRCNKENAESLSHHLDDNFQDRYTTILNCDLREKLIFTALTREIIGCIYYSRIANL